MIGGQAVMDLRDRAAAGLARRYSAGKGLTTVDAFSRVRFTADLRPESTAAVFAGSNHTDQAADVHAFDLAIGESGGQAGFGVNTILSPRHTNLRTKRLPNNGAAAKVNGILLVAERIKTPKTATTAAIVADDSNDKQNLAVDASGFVYRYVAELVSQDYSPYIQKPGGSPKEYLGPIHWEATESGVLYCLMGFPEGWNWGGPPGQSQEMFLGFELTHKTYNKEWAADTDRPWEDISNGIGPALDAAQPGATEVLANFDVTCRFIGAQVSSLGNG